MKKSCHKVAPLQPHHHHYLLVTLFIYFFKQNTPVGRRWSSTCRMPWRGSALYLVGVKRPQNQQRGTRTSLHQWFLFISKCTFFLFKMCHLHNKPASYLTRVGEFSMLPHVQRTAPHSKQNHINSHKLLFLTVQTLPVAQLRNFRYTDLQQVVGF